MDILNVPSIRVKVKNSFLGCNPHGYEEGYLIAIQTNPNKILNFTVHLRSGALFSNLPIEAIYCEKFNKINGVARQTRELQPWTCLDGPAKLIVYDHLENYNVICKVGDEKINGNYLMTIAYGGRGLSDDPEQVKTHNIIVLETGQLAALPNNYILFKDKFFTDNNLDFPKHYRRQSKWYFSD